MAKKRKSDISNATERWTVHIRSTQQFCFTATEPSLAWIPGAGTEDGSVSQYVALNKRKLQVVI